MKGDTGDINTAASSDAYLGRSTSPAPGSPAQRLQRPIFKGVKVSVDAERYVEKIKPLPCAGGTFQIRSRLLGIHKKGSGALTEIESELFDPTTGQIFYRFVSAGFAIGAHSFKDAGQSFSRSIELPSRPPDMVAIEHIAANQAHIYRLSGDYNPLHIDPESPFVSGGGFSGPILHGLCTMGHALRQVLKAFGDNDANRYRASAVRFSAPVLPGQTLITKMWKRGLRILFVCDVKETGKRCITNAYVDLLPVTQTKL